MPTEVPQIKYTSKYPRLVACDSDGCAFDVMDLKHKECFCPAFIKHFALQKCARQARQVWEFVNLYSRTRGCNRFQGVAVSIQMLSKHPDVSDSDMAFMDYAPIFEFVSNARALGESELISWVQEREEPALQALLAWTREVNVAVKVMCRDVSGFPGVGDALRQMAEKCDVLVVSQAPHSTLVHEWTESGFANFTASIAGQEFGDKASQIKQAMLAHPQTESVLVLGDAPGDQYAAEIAGVHFFPIVPNDEIASWEFLISEGLPLFLRGEFDSDYQARLIQRFSKALPSLPPWHVDRT